MQMFVIPTDMFIWI